MRLSDSKLPIVYLRPAELYIGNSTTYVVTVLGSCLAVTMHHSQLQIGAICHALIARCGNKETCEGSCDEEFRYVDCAIPYMLESFENLGIKRSEIEVKLFGAADTIVFGSKVKRAVGKENIDMAQDILRQEHLHVKISDIGGTRGRKIFFNIRNGNVYLKYLKEAPTNERVKVK